MLSPGPEPVRDLDWSPDRARELGEQILDLYTRYLAGMDGPATPRVTPAEVRAAVALDVPEEPLDDAALVAHLATILDSSLRTGSGGFLAYISGGGTVPGALADLLASGLNPNVGGWVLSPAATEIERRLVAWTTDRFGLPTSAGGHLVAGGSLANLTALKLARDRVDAAIRREGVGARRLAVYASAEAHFTIDRAADVLGLGESAVRKVPVSVDLTLRVDELERMLERDLADGVVPMAIVGTAGTTGTGAIDPLERLAALAADVGAWFHVDAAYGGAIALSDHLRPLLRGIEQADSITFDAHKWLSAPTVAAFVLVRDAERLPTSFSAHAAYVEQDREVAARAEDMGFEGLQLSRGFLALRVWVSLLAHGRAAYARRIEHDVALTEWLARRIEEEPDLELVCPPSLSICCFRYVPVDAASDAGYVDRLNDRLMTELQIDGRVFPSNALVHGRTAIRTCIVGYRTETEHLERLLALTRELGVRLHADGVVR